MHSDMDDTQQASIKTLKCEEIAVSLKNTHCLHAVLVHRICEGLKFAFFFIFVGIFMCRLLNLTYFCSLMTKLSKNLVNSRQNGAGLKKTRQHSSRLCLTSLKAMPANLKWVITRKYFLIYFYSNLISYYSVLRTKFFTKRFWKGGKTIQST